MDSGAEGAHGGWLGAGAVCGVAATGAGPPPALAAEPRGCRAFDRGRWFGPQSEQYIAARSVVSHRSSTRIIDLWLPGSRVVPHTLQT